MVEEETRRYRPTKNYLEHLPPLNLSAFEVRKLLYSDIQHLDSTLLWCVSRALVLAIDVFKFS